MRRRDLISKLANAGFKLLRHGDEHDVYYKKGCDLASIPRHREINENTAREILKKAGVK